MARTLDPEAHALRRDAFMDVAQRVITTRGYDALNIQEVLDDLGASKGAFYHYFASKAALFEATVARMVDAAVASMAPVVGDPNRTAPAKFHDMFTQIASLKTEQRDFIEALIKVWFANENVQMRDRFRRGMAVYLTPNFERIIRQGDQEGVFDVQDAASTAIVLVTLIQGVNEIASQLFIDRKVDRITAHEAFDILDAFTQAANRVLGAAPGTVSFGDRAVLDQWFA